MNTYFICCGGSGGHVAPGIAVAEKLIQKGQRCHLIISQKPIDHRLSQNYPHLNWIKIVNFPLYFNPFRFLKFFYGQLRSLVVAALLLKRLKPCKIIAFGGFNCAGIVLMAWVFKIPVALHESNRQPGKVIRFLSRFANCLYLPTGTTLKNLSSKRSVTIKYAGYPVRQEIQHYPQEEARLKLGLAIEGKLLVVLGGSQGADALTQWAEQNFEALAENEINLFCLSGVRNAKNFVLEKQLPNSKVIKGYFRPFCETMGQLLSSATLALTRSGAGAIAECAQCLLPMILVPYPFAADNHQFVNANFVATCGAGKVVLQNEMPNLLASILQTIADTTTLESMQRNLAQVNTSNSLELITNDALC